MVEISHTINDCDLFELASFYEEMQQHICLHKYQKAYVIRDYRKPYPISNQIVWSGFNELEAAIQLKIERMRAAIQDVVGSK